MVGNVAIINNAAFSRSVMQTPPPATSALWCYFGKDLASSQNLVGPPLVNVGTGPVYPPANNYASITAGTAGLTTTIADVAGSFTLLFAVRTQASTGLTNCISNLSTGPSAGVRTRLGNGPGLDAFVPGSGTTLPALAVPDGTMSFKAYALTRQVSVDATMYALTDGLSFTSAGVSTRTLGTSPWMIGESPAGTDQSTQLDIAFAGILYSYHDADGVARLYQSIKQTLALRGVPV